MFVRGLRKAYGALQAVDGVDLDISRGEVFALLGPNGAGKTTTVEILEGYRHRDDGQVTVLGHDPGRERAALKPRIGIVLQSTGVDRYLTVAETLAMYADFYPHPRSPGEVIELVGLGAKRDARVTTLSGGQQRRLDVGVALVGDPELLFLDEPTTGFDPSARREAWQVVKNLAELGKTVLLTTHYMDEAQFLADRVAVIAAGRIVAEGPPSSLGGRDRAGSRVSFRLAPGTALPEEMAYVTGPDGRFELVAEDLTATLHNLTSWAVERGIELDDLSILRPTLEDVYLELTGGPRGPADSGPLTGGAGHSHARSGMVAAGTGPSVNAVALTARQVRYANKAFWRNPASAFFTFAFPLMFLVIFTALLGSGTVHLAGRTVKESTYYVAAMAAFAVISACYTNVAMTVTFQRDAGVLKRIDGTPLPAGAYFTARVLHALFIAILLVAITAAFGRLAYQASIPSGTTLVRFLVMLVVGAGSFCALAFAITTVIPNADASPAIVNATILPLLFLSGIFIPLGANAPSWIVWVSRIFPVRHFALGLQAGFLGTSFNWVDVGVVAAWGVAGLFIAIRRFSWEPRA